MPSLIKALKASLDLSNDTLPSWPRARETAASAPTLHDITSTMNKTSTSVERIKCITNLDVKLKLEKLSKNGYY